MSVHPTALAPTAAAHFSLQHLHPGRKNHPHGLPSRMVWRVGSYHPRAPTTTAKPLAEPRRRRCRRTRSSSRTRSRVGRRRQQRRYHRRRAGGFAPRREARSSALRREEERRPRTQRRPPSWRSRRPQSRTRRKEPVRSDLCQRHFQASRHSGGGRGLPRDANPDAMGDARRGMGERSTSYGRRGCASCFDDRRRDPARDRRRCDRGLDADDGREEGEIVDSPRTRRTGGADTASDWRRPGDRDRAALLSLPSDRLRPGERRGAPACRRSSLDRRCGRQPGLARRRLGTHAVDNRAPLDSLAAVERTLTTRFPGDGMGGAVDSIQAFKAQMKERERRERLARGEPSPSKGRRSNLTTNLWARSDTRRTSTLRLDAASQQSELDASAPK